MQFFSLYGVVIESSRLFCCPIVMVCNMFCAKLKIKHFILACPHLSDVPCYASLKRHFYKRHFAQLFACIIQKVCTNLNALIFFAT